LTSRSQMRDRVAPGAPAPRASIVADFTRVDWGLFDCATGLRAAFFALTPLLLGLATNQVNAGVVSSIGALNEGVVSTLGAINLSFQEGVAPSRSRLAGSLAAGCVGNALAFSLGTLVGTTGTTLAVLLVGLGVFVAMTVRLSHGLELVGLTAAVVFTVGVGLPGGSVGAAGTRFWLMLAGGAWALLGGLLQWSLRRKNQQGQAGAPVPPPSRASILTHSLAVAVTVALGLGIAESAGLARDYWVMLTIVMSLRMVPVQTVSFTVMRVAGTAAGALLGLLVTLATGNQWVLLVSLAAMGFAMFSTRNVNLVVFTLFLTSFIIILLNLAFPGSWDLAFFRIFDVALGGALCVAASGAMWLVARLEARL